MLTICIVICVEMCGLREYLYYVHIQDERRQKIGAP
jgi:hypothetical protein